MYFLRHSTMMSKPRDLPFKAYRETCTQSDTRANPGDRLLVSFPGTVSLLYLDQWS